MGTAAALFSGFMAIFYLITATSFFATNLPAEEQSEVVLGSAALLIAVMGAIYVWAKSHSGKRPDLRNKISKGIIRNVILAIVAGVLMGMLYPPTFSLDASNAMQFSPLLLKIQLIFQGLVQDVLLGSFIFWFTASFASISVFDLVTTRQRKNPPTSPRLNKELPTPM